MIVFLDISGPLLTEASAAASRGLAFPLFERQAVGRVKPHLAPSQVKVVVSSNYALEGREVIEEWFRLNGFPLRLHEDWTSAQAYGVRRSEEIQAWLNRNPAETAFVIIDDIEMPPGPLRDRQVLADPSCGISERNEVELKALLQTLAASSAL